MRIKGSYRITATVSTIIVTADPEKERSKLGDKLRKSLKTTKVIVDTAKLVKS